jgi:hypothetical protein
MKTFIIVSALILVAAIWIGSSASSSNEVIKPYQDQVAQDFVDQYEMAKEHGTPTDMCVRAQLVAEGYLQAENEAKYREWRAVQKADCKAAGVPY